MRLGAVCAGLIINLKERDPLMRVLGNILAALILFWYFVLVKNRRVLTRLDEVDGRYS
jgi:hypothetical protein